MATQTRKLDRKARTAIAVAIALLFAGPLYLTVRHVMSKFASPEEIKSDDDQLVILDDGSTLLVRHGSTGRIMANWLREDKGGAKSFEVGNENFSPGSATLSPDGWEHLAQFAQMLRAHHEVSASILYSAHHGIPATVQLEHMRADRIHDEAINQGDGEGQISVAQEGYDKAHNTAGDEGLEVVLTNHG